MIIEITESVYKGILLEHVKDQGWKCELADNTYLFPNYVAAQSAIDEIFADIKPIITKNKGKNMKKQDSTSQKDYLLNKQILDMLPNIAQGEFEHAQLVMGLLEMQQEALQKKNISEVERINSILLEDAEANLDSLKIE